jgi:predicted MPP superfamily phosphohydrolase
VKRRDFLLRSLGGAAATAIGVVGYTFAIEPHWLEIVARSLPIAGLPASLVGRRLVHLSDIHVGPRVSDEYVVESFRRAGALGADIVAITGDLISYRGPEQFAQLRAVLRTLPRGRVATVAVLGNHDYGFGWRMPDVAAAVERELRDAGVTVLDNQALDVGGLAIVGLGDLWANQFMPNRVMEARAGVPTLVLAHNPDSLDLDGWRDYRGWVLAGHTHGGQCKPPFLPPPLLPVKNKRYTSGAIPLSDGRAVYISRGVGHLIPVRFNVRPEITAFTLASAPAGSTASESLQTAG